MSTKDLTQYKTYEDLMSYCVAQDHALSNQSRKVMELEQELSYMKLLVNSQMPALEMDITKIDIDGRDEHVIAQIEIQKLRKHSMVRELTMEETKRLEIYTKILSISPPKKEIEVFDASDLSTDVILNAITGRTDDSST